MGYSWLIVMYTITTYNIYIYNHRTNHHHQSGKSHGKSLKITYRSIWVNYNISLTWILRPFGDDSSYKPWFQWWRTGFGRNIIYVSIHGLNWCLTKALLNGFGLIYGRYLQSIGSWNGHWPTSDDQIPHVHRSISRCGYNISLTTVNHY